MCKDSPIIRGSTEYQGSYGEIYISQNYLVSSFRTALATIFEPAV